MNKVALITGSSKGIGLFTAKEFAKNNYDIVINYNTSSEEDVNRIKKEIEDLYNVKCITIKCDISVEEEVKNMVDFVIRTYGRIDVLVNNAGIALDSDLQDKTKQDFMRVLEVNLCGTFLVSRLVLNYMKKQLFGSVVNVSSNNGIDCYYPESLDYDISKAGIISLTHNLAKYYAPIRINTVAPGWVNTSMNKELDENFKQQEIEKILLKRFAEPEEIAKTIYFVATSSYINDTIIRVDGGINV